ncbi:HlyD family secretion protein [Phnomibacter ginsenosidimutans]|uniref:HlyD family efflux transporter periplasmic adaptor subunit n=1 Tax=Phnomibacter ginsenosidimutans TaxID=2676868 RepID=A0A6I6GC04_9BACT|nr:HlyD family efflux transporter periplasmic adaptor subunit [Phnomibacter ginsenosidimutans]QGW27740.1 HlyD family efflux transporter periplasmic adaptor subunit [Phnomibacter ginsenosidimutans]
MKKLTLLIAAAGLLQACGNKGPAYDATGTFEADEVIVSAEVAGKILWMPIEEGQTIAQDSVVVKIDAGNLALQKAQIEASANALQQKTNDVQPQLKLLQEQLQVQQAQMATLEKEKRRFEALVKADAATPKQLDDIVAQINVLQQQMLVTRQQMNVQQSTVGTANRSILSEQAPLTKRADIIADQINRSNVINPINGTVLLKYANAGEVVGAGKALYKIADLSNLQLRAYITGDQLSQIKLGQQVKVLVDDGKKNYKTYSGAIIWIADKAEFTPKTIQTKDERANLVYAIKVLVPNDGYLKIGQYGEVDW